MGCINIDASKRKRDILTSSNLYSSVYGKKSFVYFIVVDITSGEIVFSLTKLYRYLLKERTLPPSLHEVFGIFKDCCSLNS